MSVQIERWVFSVDDFHRLREAGFLSEDSQLELIRGEILKMNPTGRRHVACGNRLNALLNRGAAARAIISVQNPLRLDDFPSRSPTSCC